MERFLAGATLAVLAVVQTRANNPLDLWLLNGALSAAVLVAYALVAAVVLVAPSSPSSNALLGAVGVVFWSLRSIDLAHATVFQGQRLATAAAVHALLALFIALYYASAARRFGFWARHGTDG